MQTGHYTVSSVQELVLKSWGFLENQSRKMFLATESVQGEECKFTGPQKQ